MSSDGKMIPLRPNQQVIKICSEHIIRSATDPLCDQLLPNRAPPRSTTDIFLTVRGIRSCTSVSIGELNLRLEWSLNSSAPQIRQELGSCRRACSFHLLSLAWGGLQGLAARIQDISAAFKLRLLLVGGNNGCHMDVHLAFHCCQRSFQVFSRVHICKVTSNDDFPAARSV
jgi:hypothetical protein